MNPDWTSDERGNTTVITASHTNASRTHEGGESLLDLIQKLGEAVKELQATLPKGNPSEKQAD